MAGCNKILTNVSRRIASLVLTTVLVVGVVSLSACGGGGSGNSNGSLGGDTGGSSSATTDNADDSQTSTGVKVGNGTGASFVEGVIGASTTAVTAGQNVTLRVNFVDQSNDALGAVINVSFTSNCYASGIAGFSSTSVNTNTGGFGTVVYTPNGCSGDDEVVATATVDGEVLTASVTLSVAADTVLGITYEGATNSTLNLAGTGGNETTVLTFRLVGALGASIVGESVSFSIQGDEGGAALAAGTETAVSGTDGTVTTVLQSGTAATNIRVTATHDATLVSATSDSIVISSGLPIQKSFSLTQSVYNPKDTFDTDGIEVTYNILAADQFGNIVTEGTQVNFYAECGVIEPSCQIDATSSCSVIWRSNTASQADGDGLCAILAFTEGVETFNDVNGNFVYENVDTFNIAKDDLPEPFLDVNDNGVYDFGELFVDTATGVDGQYDYPNGEWDGQCLQGIVPTANCDGDDSAVIFAQSVVAITCDKVLLIPTPNADPAEDLALLDSIDLTSGDAAEFVYTLEDGCTSGNPPGAGIPVSFSADGFDILNGESGAIENNLIGPVTYTVEIRGDDIATVDGELVLKVGDDTVRWSVSD
ncbi:hypothetical protein [Halioxenophilus sp. WMMB6]|uniref:hypothetical protein n=1 Tax=Halioxenophilus sp. WMMB6 TaxID=3073815 RepID=UPI00295F122F|nr:hypothetical protein [Halioxenophilus sp. WMMB6]